MAVQIQYSQVINRPVEKVFHFMVDEHVRNHPRWDSDIELWLESEAPMGVGTVIHRRNSRSGTPVEGRMEVVEYEPNRAFSTVIHDGPVKCWDGSLSNPQVMTGLPLPCTLSFPRWTSLWIRVFS